MILPAFAGVALRHGSHFLFLRRGEKSRHWPLHWTLPGGKIESGEDVVETALRETLEETGVHIDQKDILSSTHHTTMYIDGRKDVFLFLLDNWTGMPENLEENAHDSIAWMTLDELRALGEPIVPHVEEALIGLLSGKNDTLSYATSV